jgi:hypothetical protein
MAASYARVPARAIKDRALTGTDIRVLCAIGLHVDKNGGGCWASSKTLAVEAAVTRNKFFSSAKKLIAAGVLTRESGHAEGASSTYRIVFDEPEGDSTKNGTWDSTKNGTWDSTRRGTRAHPKTVLPSTQKRYSPTMNSPLNSPLNNPLNTSRGGSGALQARELIKAVRECRNPQFPGSLAPGSPRRQSVLRDHPCREREHRQ